MAQILISLEKSSATRIKQQLLRPDGNSDWVGQNKWQLTGNGQGLKYARDILLTISLDPPGCLCWPVRQPNPDVLDWCWSSREGAAPDEGPQVYQQLQHHRLRQRNPHCPALPMERHRAI